MLLPIFFKYEFHHVILSIVRKININVRQLVQSHPLLVEKTPEIQIKPNRADAADTQAVADEAVCGAPACYPLDASTSAFLQHVPGDEEIILITDLRDDAE